MPLHIERTRYAPTIMGPFAYLKNMQCNHAIINLESQTHDYLKEAILFLSCATIPLKLFQFTGIIMVLVIDDKQYQFVFYYGAVLNTVERIGDVYYLVIEQRQYRIEIKMRTG